MKAVLSEYGIHVLEEFPDGQILWGNEPLSQPYREGDFQMADYYLPGRYDIFTVRGLLSKLDKAGKSHEIEQRLYDSINEELEDEDDVEDSVGQ